MEEEEVEYERGRLVVRLSEEEVDEDDAASVVRGEGARGEKETMEEEAGPCGDGVRAGNTEDEEEAGT